jgi:lysophospholipase L1-like esterase
VLGLEAAYALLKPSPFLPEFDPSGEFGDPANPMLRVAVLGDSSVTAPGITGPEEIWITLACERLAEKNHVVLESFAVGGSMAHHVIDSQLEAATLFGPDLVFVSVGTSDAIKGVPRRRFAGNMDRLIGELSETEATIIQGGVGELGSIPRPYPPLSNLMSRRARRFDAIHWEIAKEHGSSVIPQRNDDLEIWYSDRDLWADDQFHVSAQGHARWANTVWDTVEPLVYGENGSN